VSFQDIVARQRQSRGEDDIGSSPRREVREQSRVFALPPRKRNVLERYQWQAKRQRLERNKEVKRRWKSYLKATKKASRMDYNSWLEFNYGDDVEGPLSQYTGD
jgi:hypothetical protein